MSELEPTRTCSNPTATETFRALLDERGVEYMKVDFIDGERITSFDANGREHGYHEFPDGETLLRVWHLTPEQAIAATLGATDARPTQVESSGTCHDVWDVELTGRLRFQCSECGAVSLEITPRFCPVCGRKVVEPTTNDVGVKEDA